MSTHGASVVNSVVDSVVVTVVDSVVVTVVGTSVVVSVVGFWVDVPVSRDNLITFEKKIVFFFIFIKFYEARLRVCESQIRKNIPLGFHSGCPATCFGFQSG